MGLNWRNCRGGRRFPAPGRGGIGLDAGQGQERGAHGADLPGGHPLEQLGIDRLGPADHGVQDFLPARGQPERDPPAVTGIRIPFQVTAAGQDVDGLAHGLLGDSEPGRQVRPGPARGSDPGQQGRPVPGQVPGADGLELGPDGLGVHTPGGTHQGRCGELVLVWTGHPARLADRKLT